MLKTLPPMSNAERQRRFVERHPGYYKRYRLKLEEPSPAPLVVPEPMEARREPTEVRPEPTLFDLFPPFELKAQEKPQEEKPIDLALAGLAM